MTKVEWVARPGTIPESWNPITGCSKTSEGCRFCYAERMARRLAGRCGYPEAPHHFNVTLHPDRLKQPLHWKKPRTVFTCSMSDLFHVEVSDEFISKVFQVMYECPQHTFQVLTKRPERMRHFILTGKYLRDGVRPIEWIWLGVTAENQAAADERIPLLLQTPAAVRFVSCEPLLGPIDLRRYLWCLDCAEEAAPCEPCLETRLFDGPKLSWCITGGESGPGARPIYPQWARSIRDQCLASGTPWFFKQWGAWAPYIESSFVGEVTGHKVLPDGTFGEFGDGDTGIGMSRVGKKRAGHLFDEKVWHQWPER